MTKQSVSNSDSDSPSSNSTGNKSSRCLSPIALIIVAIIGFIGTCILAFSPMIQCWVQPYTCAPVSTPTFTATFTPTLTPTVTPTFTSTFTPVPTSTEPTISISSDVRDIGGNLIDMNSAPFQAKVSGTVSNIAELYVYLIVADSYHHYVQPGLGKNVDNNFSNLCQLGTIGIGFGQQYTIYAVVTDKPYAEFAWFEGESYIAKSKELKITRESMPTPTTAP